MHKDKGMYNFSGISKENWDAAFGKPGTAKRMKGMDKIKKATKAREFEHDWTNGGIKGKRNGGMDMSDNEALQRMIDSSGVVKIPAAKYSIDITKPLKVTLPTTIDFTGSTLRAIASDKGKGAIIRVTGANITVRGGIFIGDKLTGKGFPYGNGAHGVHITDGARGVTIDNVQTWEHSGDGIYIGKGEHITVSNCTSLRNRRQGLSIISGKSIIITNSKFEGTRGTQPADGIDIEPDRDDVIEGVTITRCVFKNNAGAHIEIADKRGIVRKITIKDNTFDDKSAPLKIQDQPPALWMKAISLVTGNYSTYPKEVTI